MYIYWFKTHNGDIEPAEERVAWNWYSSDGSWKHRPQYLGATLADAYLARRNVLVREYRNKVDELLLENIPSELRERKEEALARQKQAALRALHEELISTADKSIVPARNDVYVMIEGKETKSSEYSRIVHNMGRYE